ncbi:MAG: pyrimidine 5'-nucleotidase, partial [Anaerolineales bacterium]
YPASSGIWEDVAHRIHTFLETTLNLSPQEAVTRREHYYKTYGTTLRGLQREAQVEPISFMEYIHDVPIETKIKDDPLLRDLLGSINIPKYIFTNASLDHAERVLSHLGLEECFDGIIDIIRLEYANKPDPLAYKRALQIVGEPEPGKCVLIDDSLMNLETGAHMGMTTVHVGSNHDHSFTPDYSISTIHQLLDVLPELKDHDGFSEDSNG